MIRIAAVLMLLALLASGALTAQEAPPRVPPPGATQPEPPRKSRAGADDTFTPSEDISEDASVAFPVDI